MSNHEEEKPLTRREIRLRQMREDGLLDPEPSTTKTPDDSEKGYTSDISYLRDVTPQQGRRARRPKQFDSPFMSRAEEPEEQVVRPFFDDIPEQKQDDEVAPPTQPFSVEDLREIEEDLATPPPTAAVKKPAADKARDTISVPAHQLREAAKAAAQAERAEKALMEALTERDEAEKDFSYPDIQPIADERSIFDDQEKWAAANTHEETQPEEPEPETAEEPTPQEIGGFDALLDDAISEEDSQTQTSTSALILPTMPETDVTGTLGATGELFVTGSFELPKSLSETGGHAGEFGDLLKDTHEDGDFLEELATTQFDIAPKAATASVSALETQKTERATPETVSDSKKPLVYALIGGGLILTIGAAALIIFGAGIFQ